VLRRIFTSSYMAGVAVAALAHGGMLAGVFLLAPAGPLGLGPKDDVFLVTLFEEPVTVPAQVPEPEPPAQEPPSAPPEKVEIAPSPVAEVPAAPAPAPEAATPAENVPVVPASDPPAEAAASEQESGPAFVTLASDTAQQVAATGSGRGTGRVIRRSLSQRGRKDDAGCLSAGRAPATRPSCPARRAGGWKL
jgi:hypothetical protein